MGSAVENLTTGIDLGPLGNYGIADVLAGGVTLPTRAAISAGRSIGLAGPQAPDTNVQIDPSILAQQQAFIQALQAQSQGLGPSLAQAQLKQASSEAQQKAAAMAASQRGINPALAQRQALQAQANIQQQAGAEAAKIAAQQQLQSQALLAQQLNQAQQQQLEQQRIAKGLEGAKYQSQMGLAGAGLTGLAGIGAAMLNKGGMVKGYADGGIIPDGMSPVAAHIIGDDGYPTPEIQLAHGAMVPGRAVVDGDSYANDKVPAMLSPGEIVIPRSVALSSNAPEKSKKFVEKTLQQSPVAKMQYQDGGQVPEYLAPIPTQAPAAIAPSKILGIPQISEMPAMPASMPSESQDPYEQYRKVQALYPLDPAKVEKIAQEYGLQKPPGLLEQAQQWIGKKRLESEEAEKKQLESIGLRKTMPSTKPIGEIGDQQAMPIQQQQQQQLAQRISTGLPSGVGMVDAFNQNIAGMTQEASILGRSAREKAQALADYNKMIADREKSYQANIVGLQGMIDQTNKDLSEAKIDPNRYMGNMSTAGKIGQALAIMAGAIGGQMTGRGGNVALDIINNNINKDIEAQKDNLNTKKTLLSGYYQQLGDLKSAEAMTRATIQDQVLNQMKVIELNATDPIAKARLQQNIAVLQQEKNKNLAVLGAKQAIAQATSGVTQQSPEAVLEMARATDPKMAEDLQKRIVPGVGFAQREVPDKVIEQISSKKDLDMKLRNLYDFATKYSGTLDPSKRAQGEALSNDAFLAIKQAAQLGTLDKGTQEFAEKLLQNPAEFTAKIFGQPKYRTMIESNQKSLNNLMKAYGVKTPKSVSELEKPVGR